MQDIKKLGYIDAIRGIAVLMVLFVHTLTFLSSTNLNSYFKIFVGQGRMGVQLFYMASAFTLFYSMAQRSEGERFSNFNFYIRRFFRIAPMFYLAIIYYFWQYTTFPAISMEATNLGTLTMANLASHFIFLHGLSPYWINTIVPGGWSVGVEMMFYLLVPAFYFTYKRFGVKFLYIALTLSTTFSWIFSYAIFLIKGLEMNQYWYGFMYFNIFNQLPVFILGMILYHNISHNITKEGSFKNLFLANKNIFYIFVGSIFLFILSLYLTKITTVGTFAGSMLMRTSLLGIFIILLAHFRFKIFVNRLFVYIGKISYSMYLTHFAFLFIIPVIFSNHFKYLDNYFRPEIIFIIYFILLTVCTILLSAVTYKYIEKPGIIMGNKIIERRNFKKR